MDTMFKSNVKERLKEIEYKLDKLEKTVEMLMQLQSANFDNVPEELKESLVEQLRKE